MDTDLQWPERTWERSVPLPEVTRTLLEAHLAAWPELLDRTPERLGGGLRHLVIRLGDVVARIGPEASLRKEAQIHRLLEGEVRVARIVDERPGVLLLEHVAHEPLPPTLAAGRAVGRSAARIHAHPMPQAGMLGADLELVETFPSVLDGLRGWAEGLLEAKAGERLGNDAPRVRRLWDANETALREAGAPPVLTHADYKPVNLKWLPEIQDVLVLDWEFAWAGAAIFDAGMLIRWDPPEPFVRGFEEGCRDAGAPLPDDWRRIAGLYDLFNLVGFLGQDGETPIRDGHILRRVHEMLQAAGA